MRYSSVHYLSNQFKKVTGLSVSDYKREEEEKQENHSSMTEALMALKDKGYIYNFSLNQNCIEFPEKMASFQLEEVDVKEAYRLEKKGGIDEVTHLRNGNQIRTERLYG